MTVRYNKLIDDVGKGRQTYRAFRATAVLANGTVTRAVIQPPFPFAIKRVRIGSAVATDISGEANVIVIADGADLDTAPGAGNRAITPVVNFTTKKLLDSDAIAAGSPGALTALGAGKFAANSIIVLSVAHSAAVVNGDVDCIVEIDSVGQTYGAYDGDSSSQGAYD